MAKPTKKKATAPVVASEAQKRFQLTDYLKGLVAVLGVIGGADAIVRNVQSGAAWARDDARYVGSWTNDATGELLDDARLTSVPEEIVWLTLHSDRGTLSGSIHSGQLCKHLPWNYVLFEGTNGIFGASGRAFDVIAGKRAEFANFDLKLNSDGTLRMTPKTHTSLFPQPVTMWRRAPDDSAFFRENPPLCRQLKGVGA